MNSDFSRRTDESIPYRESSDLISDSFIDEMSGSVGVMVDTRVGWSGGRCEQGGNGGRIQNSISNFGCSTFLIYCGAPPTSQLCNRVYLIFDCYAYSVHLN